MAQQETTKLGYNMPVAVRDKFAQFCKDKSCYAQDDCMTCQVYGIREKTV